VKENSCNKIIQRRVAGQIQPQKCIFEEKVPEKVPGGFGAEPGQVQRGSGEGSGEGLGRLWCRARSGSIEFAAI